MPAPAAWLLAASLHPRLHRRIVPEPVPAADKQPSGRGARILGIRAESLAVIMAESLIRV
jgi:hypothetical protein